MQPYKSVFAVLNTSLWQGDLKPKKDNNKRELSSRAEV